MKKGFTLIELLAVIVILAIIALIATPIVLNIINDSKESATLRSADFYLDGVEYAIAQATLESKTIHDGTYDIIEDGNICLEYDSNNKCKEILKVEVDGEVPKLGSITFQSGKTTEVILTFGSNTITKDSNGQLVRVKTLQELAITSVDLDVTSVDECATSGICDPGTAFAIKVNDKDTYKFYVLSDDGNKVTLITSEDLGESVVWYDSGEPENLDSSHGPLTALDALKTRTATWSNILAYNYILDYGMGTYSGDLVRNVRARLPKLSDIRTETIECSSDSPCPSWLSNSHFWLSVSYSDGMAYMVWDYISDTATLAKMGLRPVIEILK